MDTSHPVVLRPGQGRGVAFIILGLAFAGLMAWIGPGAGGGLLYWGFAVVLVGAWLGFGIYMIDPAHYLRLDAGGLTIHSLRHTTTYRWQELWKFYAEGTDEQPMVTFELADPEGRGGVWAGVTHAVTGGREVLPSTYGLSAPELARLLNAWREQIAGPPTLAPAHSDVQVRKTQGG